MTTETMTVHEALAELKVIDSRIAKEISNTTFVTINKHANDKANGIPIAEFKAQMQSGFQSVNDLIRRRDAIKRAVVLSNATTKVTVADTEYTVAEAIDMKQHSMTLRQQLLTEMTRQSATVQANIQRLNGDSLEQRANEYIRSQYGNSDMSKLSEQAKKSYDEFVKNQTVEMVDPIGIFEEIKKLSDSMQTFMVKVDAALSVSNAITEITVEY